jgi:pyridoxamine---pyruvate transaminase
MQPADLTLSAGPNDVVPEARAALAAPVLYHYDPSFIERFRQTEGLIARIFRTTSHDIVLMQGEAVLGLEAAARSLCTRGTPVLNLVSGVFGKGFGYWLSAIGADLQELQVPYDRSVTIEQVRDHLDRHPEVRVVSVVHCETPSGTLNPVREIGLLCRERGVISVVDCVASYGGIPLEAEAWGLDLLVAGPQKCLGGPPGMSLMAISPQAWAAIDANPDAPRGSFLSILDYREMWHGKGRFPFTPSVPDVNGVAAAAQALLDEGLEVVQARHERVARACRAGVRAMGLRLWPASDEICAASVTAIAVPDGLSDIGVRDHCRAVYGVQLSGGQNAGNLVRIGHMGNTARPMWMVAGLAALGRTFADLGVPVSLGSGVEAAMASLSAAGSTSAPARGQAGASA